MIMDIGRDRLESLASESGEYMHHLRIACIVAIVLVIDCGSEFFFGEIEGEELFGWIVEIGCYAMGNEVFFEFFQSDLFFITEFGSEEYMIHDLPESYFAIRLVSFAEFFETIELTRSVEYTSLDIFFEEVIVFCHDCFCELGRCTELIFESFLESADIEFSVDTHPLRSYLTLIIYGDIVLLARLIDTIGTRYLKYWFCIFYRFG